MPIDLSAPLSVEDPEIASQIRNEIVRQHEGLEMIASENFVSRAVLEAAGTVFTNKYAEGYPVRRCRRNHRPRPRQAAIWGRARQRAAALRLSGQCRRLHDTVDPGRHHSRT